MPDPFPAPDSPADPVAASTRPSTAQHWVRPAEPADAPMLEAWLQARQPLPVAACRGRGIALQGLLAQGGQGLCLLAFGGTEASAPGPLQACLPVALTPSLTLGGMVATAIEGWGDAPLLSSCLDLLADWCRAHGVRQIVLAPALAAAVGTGHYVADAGGMWSRTVEPSAKVLG